ncbi:MAG: Protein RecA [Candidatus Jorgensenbacteria bacterium GW2011_GWA1_48_13]|uniref:Protein RecA n=2 Tax=Candidatus Joergenseniibacteriota TaxID=1752739 RepID=A0A0G1Z8D5_9BACT|nr:MAG: Protein RecA [Candidatus Jorgensenbacteria bacterium GW2011_GWA1_48_13]KKU99384.1 MAG: RecA/RadA recombinase (multifunctional sos repair regulator), recombination protein RecA [Candidatus Jorgensenbacteria bacterium GW2011_GWC1_48_8]KKW15269.1 MAG: Protein RecA [Candidatus Jorgensenbacteria bacterium GW2011_GWB1_50_10]
MATKKSVPSGKEEGESLEALMESLKSRFGEGAVMTLSEGSRMKVETIPSGSFSLDIALGVGGLPKGRVIEIFGPESSGKTTLALHAIAEVQRLGGRAAFIDAEHALDPEYAKNIGVKINDLIISQPDNGEEALNILESLVRSGVIQIVVVDSVAALTPKAEIEGEMGAHHMGAQARLMSQALRKLTAIADKSKTIIIFINQIRQKIGIVWGNPETTTGGLALKFYASLRIDIRRVAQIKKGEEVVGNRVKAKVVKNKVAPPFKIAEFDIMYGEGISYEADVLNMAVKHGVVAKSGSSYTFEGEKLGVGFDNAREKLKEDKKNLEAIKKKTLEAIK